MSPKMILSFHAYFPLNSGMVRVTLPSSGYTQVTFRYEDLTLEKCLRVSPSHVKVNMFLLIWNTVVRKQILNNTSKYLTHCTVLILTLYLWIFFFSTPSYVVMEVQFDFLQVTMLFMVISQFDFIPPLISVRHSTNLFSSTFSTSWDIPHMRM